MSIDLYALNKEVARIVGRKANCAMDPVASEELLKWLTDGGWFVSWRYDPSEVDPRLTPSRWLEINPKEWTAVVIRKGDTGRAHHANRCTALALAVVDAFRGGVKND
jgi:hypothetical protein